MANRSRIILLSIGVMGCVAAVAVAATISVLYHTAFEQNRQRLADIAKSHTQLIEAVVRFNEEHPEGAAAAMLTQIVDAHVYDEGIGETGEFTLAKLVDGEITFLLDHRHQSNLAENAKLQQVPMSSPLAEPMRLALQGQSGTIIGVDYRGEKVLAAYEPIPELGYGVVAKMDMAEIRRPFQKAGLISLAVGSVIIAIGTVVVVNTSKSFFSRLEESESRASAILETVVDPIITISEKGFIKSFNLAAERLFGFTENEVLETNISRLMPSPHQEKHDNYLRRYCETGEKRIIGTGREVIGKRKDGSTVPLHLSVSEVLTRKGGAREKDRLFTGVARDLTEMRENIELKKAEANLLHAKKTAEAANRAKSEFLANMSHEIRTPMTAILGFTDILLENVTEPESIDAARTVKKNGDYLINLINDILDLSKIESEKLEVEKISCSPREIITEVSTLMQVRAEAKGLPMEVCFEGLVPETIQTDPTRLRQILINVVGNAIKFTEAGSIQIVTRLLNETGADPKLQFDVIDSGIGIADAQIEKLFVPFMQADNSTTRRFGGTGLGLTISKRLVEVLGGNISVKSTQGSGTTFSITVATGPLAGVPLHRGDCKPINEQVAAQVDDRKSASLLACRILLAEDGPDNQRLISFILKKAGAKVSLANNGQEALDLAAEAEGQGCPFDVILMDMQMPVMDGYVATKKLRETKSVAPIIALTAHAMTSDRQKCLDAGCDDYLTKPVDRKKLVETVASYAKPSGTAAQSAS